MHVPDKNCPLSTVGHHAQQKLSHVAPLGVHTFNIRVLHRPLSEFLDFNVGNQRFNIKKKTFLSEESLQIHSVKWYKSIGIS